MRQDRRFFTTLDGIRGVAAIAVVMVHTKLLFGAGTVGENGLAVDIFFILSGVVITNAYEYRLLNSISARDFVEIRLIRLYPLYIFGTAIGLLAIVSGIVSNSGAGYLPLAIVLAVFMIPDLSVHALFPLNFPAWSLFFELWVNILYASTFRSLTIRVLGAIMAVSALGLIAALYFGHHHTLSIGWTTTNIFGGFFRVGYSFFAGVLLYRLSATRKLAPYRDQRMAFLPWLVVALVAVLLGTKPPGTIEPYYQFILVVLCFPAIVYCALWFEPAGVGARIFKFLGSVSYAVYAVHVPLYRLFRFMIEKGTGIPVDSLAPWAGFCFIGVLVPLCWAFDKFYDGPVRGALLARRLSKQAVPKKTEARPHGIGDESIERDAA